MKEQDWITMIEGEKGRIREGDIYPQLKAWVDRGLPTEILEIGCGQGICSDKIDLTARNYTGLEPAPIMRKRANELYARDNRRFVAGSAFALPFSAQCFDAAFSVAVWHLLNNIKQAATELSRVLKPDGHFLIISANPEAYSQWTEHYTDTQTDGRRFEGKTLLSDNTLSLEVLYLHTMDELRNSLRAAGLEIQETTTIREKFISFQGRKTTT